MNKLHYCLIALLFVLYSCRQDEPSPGAETQLSVVTGQIQNYEKYPNTKIVNLQKGVLVYKETRLEGKINEDGSFRIQFKQSVPEDFILKPFSDIYLFINPGDSIHVNIDLDNRTTFDGDAKEVNEILNAYYSEGYFSDNLHENVGTLSNLSADEYRAYRDSIFRRELSNLEHFSTERSVPAALKASLQAHILNKENTRLIEYGISNYSFLNQSQSPELEMAENYRYFQQIKTKIDQDLPKTIGHSSATRLLDVYSAYLFQKVLNLSRSDFMNRADWDFLIINGIVENEDNDLIKENLLYRHAKLLLAANKLKEYQQFEPQFAAHIQSDHLKNELALEYDRLRKNGVDVDPLENYNLTDEAFLDAIRKENQGKVIYLDFWATWCKPCLTDMIESKTIIEEEYEDQEIAIVYICTGTNESACQEFVRENDIAGTHLYLQSGDVQRIMSRFNNSGFPFQVLANREGEVIRKGNDLRLYFPVTKSLIAELLKK